MAGVLKGGERVAAGDPGGLPGPVGAQVIRASTATSWRSSAGILDSIVDHIVCPPCTNRGIRHCPATAFVAARCAAQALSARGERAKMVMYVLTGAGPALLAAVLSGSEVRA